MKHNIRIFLADGSRDFLFLLQDMFKQFPEISVAGTATNGRAAFDYLSAHDADLLLLDLLLPELDGLSLLRRLRDLERMPRTIVVSAFYNLYVANSVSLLGVYDFIPKPFSLDELVSRIREAGQSSRLSVIHGYDLAIREALSEFCIPPNLNGRIYAEAAIRRALTDHSVLHGITKILYPELAREFNTTSVCIERSIRSAVFRGWQIGTPERRRSYFGHLFDEFQSAPSNAKFLTAIVSHIEFQYDQFDLVQRA